MLNPVRASSRGPLTGRLLDNKYRVNSVLSRGGMGIVYLARSIVTGSTVSVKVPRKDLIENSEARDRLIVEYAAIKRVRHPSVVEVLGSGQTEDGNLYIVMEYVKGPSLARAMARGELSIVRCLEIAARLASGLHAAHQVNVIHRDLKPENILMARCARCSEVKIIDFGIARLLDSPGITRTDQILGTPCYMSPEHAMGSRNIDHKSDIYSLGVILYEMLSGCLPHTGKTAHELLMSHVNKVPVPLHSRACAEDLSRHLCDLVMACLCKSPAHRPENMSLVKNRLEDEMRSIHSAGKGLMSGSPSAGGTIVETQ